MRIVRFLVREKSTGSQLQRESRIPLFYLVRQQGVPNKKVLIVIQPLFSARIYTNTTVNYFTWNSQNTWISTFTLQSYVPPGKGTLSLL